MTRKLLSSVLAITMLSAVGSVGAISASAEEYDITGGEITFKIADGWKYDDAKYYVHIWDGREGGKGLYEWQSKSELMTIADDGETATYNVPEGNWNLMILSDSRGVQTYDAVFNQKCIGDTFTAVVDETFAPVDSPRKGYIIEWDNNPDCGRHRQISGLNVKGHAYIPGETDQTIFDDFCKFYGPQPDGSHVWNESYKEDFNITWEEAKAYVASQLDLTPEEDEATKLKSQFAEKYGVKRGLPVTSDMEIPERYSLGKGMTIPYDWVDMGDCYYSPSEETYYYFGGEPFAIPEEWDGYYDVYYFEAPDSWIDEHKDKKEDGFEIGFYWYCGSLNNGGWPGEPAKKLKVLDENGNDIYADRNIYYGFAPTFATTIIWNNGVNSAIKENKQYCWQTYDINLDPMMNDIANKIYESEVDKTIFGAYISGCLFYDPVEVDLTGGLSEPKEPLFKTKVTYFDPNTGETTTEALKDENGNYVTIPDKTFEYSKVAVNPYYDMDYTYVNKVEAPTETPTEEATNTSTEVATQSPTQTSTEKPTVATTTATQATTSNSNGTVATADNNILKVLPIILLLSMAGVVITKKERAINK